MLLVRCCQMAILWVCMPEDLGMEWPSSLREQRELVVFISYQASSNVKPIPIMRIDTGVLQIGHEILKNMVPILLVIGTSALAVIWGVGCVIISLSTDMVRDSVLEVDFGSPETTGIVIQLRWFGTKVPWTNMVCWAWQDAYVVPVMSQDTEAVLRGSGQLEYAQLKMNTCYKPVFIVDVSQFGVVSRSNGRHPSFRDTAGGRSYSLGTGHHESCRFFILGFVRLLSRSVLKYTFSLTYLC